MPKISTRLQQISLVAFIAGWFPVSAGAQIGEANGGLAASALEGCTSDLKFLNQVTGWQTGWPAQWAAVQTRAPDQVNAAIKEWSAAPDALERAEQNLRAGIDNEATAPKPVVIRVMQQVEDLASALKSGDPRYFSDSDDASFEDWNSFLTNTILPAVDRYAQFLRNQYYPASTDHIGLSVTPDGAACLDRAVTWWTGLDIAQVDVEAAGRRLLSEATDELAALLEDDETISDRINRLRSGEDFPAASRADIVRISEDATERAISKINQAFYGGPTSAILVEPMPAHMEDSFPAGFYRPPSPPTNAAAYVVNTSRPEDRRLMAEVIAFHEGVPGHHFMFTYPGAGSGAFNAGYMEGWAIYSEYVADELDLYSTDLDRQGMIAKHLWASSRLIIEPGMHTKGWSREQAIDYMLSVTALPREEVEIEIDRYIAMPGQSLSYMLGHDLIMSERERAREALGSKFDIREFHDIVLGPGVRQLPQLRDDIRAWVETKLN